ncbi:MAG: hypothetical protein K6G07_07830, partial [Lachnospiraceae bacterium]|nr:hypothetical protein [Lachnospiraceae bacterium]
EEPMYEESSDMAMEEASEAPMEEAESEAMMEATADETAQEAAEEAPDLSLSGDNRETDGTYGKKSDSTNASSAAYAADTLDVLLGCKPEDMDPVLSVLSDLGIEDATDYCYSEDVPKSLLESMRNDAKTNAEAVSYRVIEFRDTEDDGMYRMVVKIIDDTDVELLAVVKNDGSEEMIYEAE